MACLRIFLLLLGLCAGALAVDSHHHHRHHHHRHHHRHHHHHHHHGSESERDVSPVLVEVYFETHCPDSKAFVEQQLYPTVRQINSIMNVSLIPYGKATQKQDASGQWIFTCQHGPRECVGNTIESCAIKYVTDTDPSTGFPRILEFVNCMEGTKDPSISGAGCAKQVNIDYSPIDTCANGAEGNQLEHHMGVRTESLNPNLTFVPWIVINSVHTDANQGRALYDLLGLVCDNYTGTKPDACNE